MKKTLFLSLLFIFVFGGCFSVSSLNPFSSTDKDEDKKEIRIPDNAPSWLENRQLKDHMVALGVSKNVKKEELSFHKQKALLNANHNLARKIYSKTMAIYLRYLETLYNPKVFEKDVKKFAEHIALKSLTHSKITNNWLSLENELFIQIGVDTAVVAEQIQYNSKLLFDVNTSLYEHFLSNRANKEMIKELENNEDD